MQLNTTDPSLSYIHNNTWNTHYDKVIKKARKSLFHLKSLGLDRWCMPMEKTVDILKKLIFTKITFAAEITTPSTAVINKVDRFLAEAIKTTTHIPWNTPDDAVLWEAGMPDFKALLQVAKFRFHYKMSSPKCAHNKSQAYYIEGNYLYDHITPQIAQAFGGIDSDQYKKQIQKSKRSWKEEVDKIMIQNQLQRKKMSETESYHMKPTVELWPITKNINEIHQRAYLQARLKAWGEHDIICECGTEITSPNAHIFFECENEEVTIQRRTLWVMVALLAPDQIKKSTKTTQMLWLLGKPTVSGERGIHFQQLSNTAAELIYTTTKLFSQRQ